MYRKTLIPIVAALALAACDDGAGPAGTALTSEEIATLSDAMVESDFAATGEVAATDTETGTVSLDPSVAPGPVTTTTEFTVTRTCPVGGQVVMEGSHVRVWDRATHSGSSHLSLTKTHEECARSLRRVTITVNGDPNIAVEAHHEWAHGQRFGAQTLSIQGGFTWFTDDGREGACSIDIEASFDPETRTRTVVGTFCDRTIDRTTTWEADGGGGS